MTTYWTGQNFTAGQTLLFAYTWNSPASLATGTYSVDPDCTGTFTVTNGNQSPVHLQMIIAKSGNTIHDMVIDPGFATTAEAERVRIPKE